MVSWMSLLETSALRIVGFLNFSMVFRGADFIVNPRSAYMNKAGLSKIWLYVGISDCFWDRDRTQAALIEWSRNHAGMIG